MIFEKQWRGPYRHIGHRRTDKEVRSLFAFCNWIFSFNSFRGIDCGLFGDQFFQFLHMQGFALFFFKFGWSEVPDFQTLLKILKIWYCLSLYKFQTLFQLTVLMEILLSVFVIFSKGRFGQLICLFYVFDMLWLFEYHIVGFGLKLFDFDVIRILIY